MVRRPEFTLTVQEYGRATSFRHAASHLGTTPQEFQQLLHNAVSEINPDLGAETFIEYHRDSFRLVKIAGILALSDQQRIEVVPKFLSPDAPHWREDFLWIAAKTQFGSLFRQYLLPSAAKKNANLFEIIAQTWLDQFEQNQRVLIRSYIHTTWEDFALDGDSDEEDLLFPSPSGFLQYGLRLSAYNAHNQLLLDSVQHLQKHAQTPGTLLRLQRATSVLQTAFKVSAPQRMRTKSRQRMLSRHERWLPLLELSRLIMASRSLGYSDKGSAALPSYVIRTHETWESLIRLGCRRAFPDAAVRKIPFNLGIRRTVRSERSLKTTPDATITQSGTIPRLVDAKYKVASDTHDESSGSATISSADVYEGLAFMEAASATRIHLVYPHAHPVTDAPEVGQPVETVVVRNRKLVAVSLGVTGISHTGGFFRFTENLKRILRLGNDTDE